MDYVKVIVMWTRTASLDFNVFKETEPQQSQAVRGMVPPVKIIVLLLLMVLLLFRETIGNLPRRFRLVDAKEIVIGMVIVRVC